MRTTLRARTALGIATITGVALIASGCASGGDDGGDEGGDITLTIASFNDFGYTDELLQEYMDENPGVKIVHNRAATSNDARANFFQKLGAGSGLADVEAIEVDWLPEMMQYSDKLFDLSDPSVDGRWLDWKAAAATDADGRLVGYGTDIGPEAICYRSDLFAEAGLPTDRTEVAKLLEGDWDTYFSVGHDYVAKTGKAWFDSAGATYQGMSNQFTNFYEKNDGTVIATSNKDVENTFRTVLEESADLSAKLGQWSDDWFGALSTGEYATMLCPGWMLGVISGNAADTTGWDIADVFPGGGGNWGGSYLTVPAQGKHTEAAKKFAAWLTAPEQQIKAFQNAGTFPSQVEAYTDEALTGAVNEYFNNAPVGEILINRANAVDPEPPFKGPKYFQINDAAQQALTRVETGQQTIDQSWEQFVSEVNALG
jgi:cellobiose transport system substrate-binding protein